MEQTTDQGIIESLRHDEAAYAKVHKLKFKIVSDAILALKPKKILDIGAGTGTVYTFLPKLESYDIHAIEIAPEFVEMLEAKGIHTVQANIEKDPIPYGDASFDLILIDSILEHTLNPKKLISEAARLLKPDGHFVLVVPNGTSAQKRWAQLRGRSLFEPLIDNLMKREYLMRCSVFYSPSDLRQAFKSYLSIESMQFIDHSAYFYQKVFSVQLCRLWAKLVPSLRDVTIVVGKKA